MADAKIDDESLTNDSDEVVEMFCEDCKKNKQITVSAGGFCADCVEYLCDTCLYYHKKYRPDHIQKNKASMPQDFCLDKCLTHQDELYKFHCKDCDKLACPQCKNNDHQNCYSISHIPTLVQSIESGDELTNIQESIDNMVTELIATEDDIAFKMKDTDLLHHQSEVSISKHKQKLEMKYQSFLKKLDDNLIASIERHEQQRAKSLAEQETEKKRAIEIYDIETASILAKRRRGKIELLEKLTEQENKLEDDLTKARTTLITYYDLEKNKISALKERIVKAEAIVNRSVEEQIKTDQNMLKDLLPNITRYKDKLLETRTDINKKQNAKQRCQIFVAMKQAESYMSELEKDLIAKKENSCISHYAFEAAEEAIDINCDTELLFGYLKDKSEIKKNVQKEEQICLQYNISDFCIISDQCIVAIQEKRSLVLINIKTNELISKLSLSTEVTDIKSVSPDEIVVKLPRIGLQFVKITQSNQLVKAHTCSVYTVTFCSKFTVSYHRLVTFKGISYLYTRMQISDMTGKVLQDVKAKCPIVECVVNFNNNTLYVITGTKAVMRLNTEGKLTAENKSFSHLLDSIAIDKTGTVYVFENILNEKDKNTGQVIGGKLYQLSADLKTKYELETIYDSRPTCLCYCDKEDKLYVGARGKILVYKIN